MQKPITTRVDALSIPYSGNYSQNRCNRFIGKRVLIMIGIRINVRVLLFSQRTTQENPFITAVCVPFGLKCQRSRFSYEWVDEKKTALDKQRKLKSQ